MTMQLGLAAGPTSLQSASNFRSWQRDTFERGLLPVIGVAGGRGKSTVVRMIDAILRQAHLRTAVWTDLGVEIRGRRQRGEISGWSLALARLTDFAVDVAVQELDWSTINAVGLPPGSYPVMAITNLLASPDPSVDDTHASVARRAALRVAAATHQDGVLVLGGDEPALMDCARAASGSVAVTSLSREAPSLKHHVEAGGAGVWVEGAAIRSGDFETWEDVCLSHEVAAGKYGSAHFQVANALSAIAVATSIGVDNDTIREALRTFEASPAILPGSFNHYELNGFQVIVDWAAPSWHLRHLLRSINPGRRKRQITVLGDLERLPEHDVQEIGRLLGRYGGAIILHSNKSPALIDKLRKGIAGNNYPPLVIHLPTERRALNRALKTARPEDVVLMLTDVDPGPATRAIQRQLSQQRHAHEAADALIGGESLAAGAALG